MPATSLQPPSSDAALNSSDDALDDPDPVPSAVVSLLQVFAQELTDVSFPDVDGATLGLASLDERANIVRRQTEELEALRARVAVARDALEGARVDLGRHAERALAYARVYAEGQPELSDRLAAIPLGRAAKTKSPRRKGKRGRGKAADAGTGSGSPDAQLALADDAPKAALAS